MPGTDSSQDTHLSPFCQHKSLIQLWILAHPEIHVFFLTESPMSKVTEVRISWYVEYRSKQLCHDGITRRKIFYPCKPSQVPDGTPEAIEGHQRAEDKAWSHIEAVLSRPTEAYKIEATIGLGPLSGTGFFRRHGDPFEGFQFHVHVRRPDFLVKT